MYFLDVLIKNCTKLWEKNTSGMIKNKQRRGVKANSCWKSNLNSVTLATSLCSALCELLHLQLQNSIRQDHDHHHCTIDGEAVEIRILKKSTLENHVSAPLAIVKLNQTRSSSSSSPLSISLSQSWCSHDVLFIFSDLRIGNLFSIFILKALLHLQLQN